ncbi:MAG: diaminopimelate decarboxylase [Actinobacteria bacterium]|nr:diaminopimelate decarboxylase [Actinomycetota bacterium]
MDRDVLECSLDFAKLADPMKDVLTCEHGRMRFGGIDVAGMAETTPTPFFLFSATQIERNIAALRDTFRSYHPKTRVFYASKACSNLWFLDRVRRSGIDIEVNSGGELWKARKAGFQPHQIVFNGNAKSRAEIVAALQPPIEAIIVDSVFELRRVADVAADLGAQARVALRIDLNVASETHPGLRTSKGAKAGIDAGEAIAAFGLAAQLPNIELVGMHYHIGSQITRVEPYLEALDQALALLGRIETAHAIRLEHLNIGGGFAIPYYDRTADEPGTYFEAPHTLDGYAAGIGKRVHEARPDLQLYLEPGRAIAGNTAILVSRVEAEKTKLVEAEDGRVLREDWVMVDAGFNTVLEHSSYHWYYRAVVANHCGKPPVRPFRIGGPLCDGGDVYTGDPGSEYRYLPTCTKVGDVIVFFDVGAYSLECMSAYNSRDQAAAYMITDSGLRQIAARRTVEDFVANERFAPRATTE